MENKIPKIIHYIWLGKKELPEKEKKCLESWKKFCPDYELKLWNEDNFDIENSNEYVKEAYKNKKYAFVADYIRMHALYEEGGIYLDTDVELLKPFDEFLKYDFFSTFENMVMINPAIVGAKKHNIVIKTILEDYHDRSFYLDKKKTKINLLPIPITASVILKNIFGVNLDNTYQEIAFKDTIICVLPCEYYHAQDYVSGEIVITPNTHGIHRYAASWLTGKQKKEDKFVANVRKFFGDRIFRKIMKKFLNIRVKKYTKMYKKNRKLKKMKDKISKES